MGKLSRFARHSFPKRVYKTGFATDQKVYEKHHALVFAGLDRAEEILSKSDFLVGNTLTEADVRLFVTLVRFDPVCIII